jgi:hypothetical protein
MEREVKEAEEEGISKILNLYTPIEQEHYHQSAFCNEYGRKKLELRKA